MESLLTLLDFLAGENHKLNCTLGVGSCKQEGLFSLDILHNPKHCLTKMKQWADN